MAKTRSRKRKPRTPSTWFEWEAATPRKDGTLSAAGAVRRLLEMLGYTDRIREQDAVLFWKDAVGGRISEVTRAQSIRNGVLKVRVDDPAWRNELSYLKGDILTRLNRLLGRNLVSDIKFS